MLIRISGIVLFVLATIMMFGVVIPALISSRSYEGLALGTFFIATFIDFPFT